MFGYPTLWPGLRKNCIVLYNRGIKKKRSSLRAVWKGCVKEKEETTEASELTGVNS